MIRPMIRFAAAGAILAAAASPALAQECSREALQAAVDSYIEAQTTGDRSGLNFGHGYTYRENLAPTAIASGFVNQPQTIDFTNTILDEQQCEAFTEAVTLNPEHPYVLGANLKLGADGLISELGVIVTDDDDWLFSAERFYNGVKDEDWGEIPEERQDTRETMIAAARAYLAMFTDENANPPWAEQCHRQEGGMRTQGSCQSDPLGVTFPDPHFIVDTTKGAVAVLVMFNGTRPDSHLFRLNDGGIRFIHTITNCAGDFNCNFDLSDELRAEREARGGNTGPAPSGDE